MATRRKLGDTALGASGVPTRGDRDSTKAGTEQAPLPPEADRWGSDSKAGTCDSRCAFPHLGREGLHAPYPHTGAEADTLQVKATTHLDLERGRGGDTKSHVTEEVCFSHVDLAMLASVDTVRRKTEVIPLPEI